MTTGEGAILPLTFLVAQPRESAPMKDIMSYCVALADFYCNVEKHSKESVDGLTRGFATLFDAKEAEHMTVTIAQHWKNEGKTEAVLTFLESRFGEVPASIQKQLAALQDAKIIEKALQLAATCQSLKEFQKTL